MPALDVLNLVKKKMGEITVYTIEDLEYIVHVLDRKVIQVFIIEVDIGITDFRFLQSIEA